MNLNSSYWKNRLLIDFDDVVKKAETISVQKFKRLFNNSRRALSIYLNDQSNLDDLINRLFQIQNQIKEFLLLFYFTQHKLQDTVGIVVEANLSETDRKKVLKLRQQGVRNYKKYDKFAAIILLYLRNPDYLHQLHLLQVIHTRSHVPYLINQLERVNLLEWINEDDQISNILNSFDEIENDDKKSRYIGGFESLDEFYMFFIREFKRTGIMKLESTDFSTECEWIILRIPQSLNQIRVSYQSNISIRMFVPTVLGITDPDNITEDDLIIVEEKLNPIENVGDFLNSALASETNPLISIKLDPAPLGGAPVLTLMDESNKGLRRAFRWFRDKNKNLLEDLKLVSECKIFFHEHRIRIVFKHEREGTKIGYADSNLYNIEDRIDFERYMNEIFELKVVPGVKFE